MTRLLLDAELRARLQGLNEELELHDEAGDTVARVLPEETYRRLIYALAEAREPPLSPEEVERRKKETGGRCLQDILAGLRSS